MSWLDQVLSWGQQVVSFLPNTLLRLYWTEKRLADLVHITVDGQNDGVSADAGVQRASYRFWLSITNLSPFSFDIDRLHGDIYLVPGRPTPFTYLDAEKVKLRSIARIHVEGEMSEGVAAQLRSGREVPREVRIVLKGLLKFGLRDVRLFGREINCQNARIYNVTPHVKAA